MTSVRPPDLCIDPRCCGLGRCWGWPWHWVQNDVHLPVWPFKFKIINGLGQKPSPTSLLQILARVRSQNRFKRQKGIGRLKGLPYFLLVLGSTSLGVESSLNFTTRFLNERSMDWVRLTRLMSPNPGNTIELESKSSKTWTVLEFIHVKPAWYKNKWIGSEWVGLNESCPKLTHALTHHMFVCCVCVCFFSFHFSPFFCLLFVGSRFKHLLKKKKDLSLVMRWEKNVAND